MERQEALGWGNPVVERLSTDLKAEFRQITGFSPRNLWFIKQFYETYAEAPEFLKQLVSEIPWATLWCDRSYYFGFSSNRITVELKSGNSLRLI
jgi:DUF1016 N-terminal domain